MTEVDTILMTKETSDDNDDRSGYDIDDKGTRTGRKPRGGGKKTEGKHGCESFEIPHKVYIIGKNKDDHVCELYEKPAINKQMCNDYYCKLHNLRGIIHSKVPCQDHPCHTDRLFNRFGMERNLMFEQSVPFEYFPQRNIPAFPGMHGNHDYGYSRMAMPMPRYDGYEHGYSRQAMPFFRGYDAHMSYPTRRPMSMLMPMPMPRYGDEHAFLRRGMPFDGCGNQYR